MNLDWNQLRRRLSQPLERLSPYAASKLVMLLGPVARWCLRPEVLARAAEDEAIPEDYLAEWRQTPQLPATHGSCWVIFATDSRTPGPLLRSAFVLPLRWEHGRKHNPRLPVGLEQLATQVAASFTGNTSIDGRVWGLQLAEELGDVDLRDMPLECHSGWAALAAGLLVAAEGGTPDPRVWATGSWDDRSGIQPVDGLKQKLDLAVELGAQVVFVPFHQAAEAERRMDGLEIGRLVMGEPAPCRALAELSLRLESPPPPPTGPDDEEAFRRCRNYYQRQPRGEPRTTAYYGTHLLPTITQRCRSQILARYPDCRPAHMVTIVSGSPELVLLAARSLDVRDCLLLYTPDSVPSRDQTPRMQMVRDLLEADGRSCQPARFANDETLEQDIPAAIARFMHGHPAETFALDLTPGSKWMTLVANRAMPAGSWRLYVKNDTLPSRDQRPLPGSEQVVCWRD